jgi:hypothetical protein
VHPHTARATSFLAGERAGVGRGVRPAGHQHLFNPFEERLMTSNTGNTGTRDVTYNLVSILYHALQGAETYDQYIRDAEQDGDQDLAQFFRDVKEQNRQRADRAKQLLGQRLNRG